MALIGDILVKFVADFAQFATSMTDATRQIGAFGQKIDEQNGVLQRHGTTLSGMAKTLADLGKSSSVEQFSSKLDAMGASLAKLGAIGLVAAAGIGAVTFAISKFRAVEDYALSVDKLQNQYKLTSEQAQVLQLAVQQTGLAADDLKKRIDAIPGAWVNLINAARTQNLLRDNLDDTAKASKALSAAWSDFMLAMEPSGTIIAATIAVLERLTKVVHGLAEAINNALTIQTIGPQSVPQGYGGVADAYAQKYAQGPGQYDPYGLAARRAQAFAQANPPPTFANAPSWMTDGIPFPTSPTFGQQLQTIKDKVLPPTTTGGGGRTDDESIEAQIKRYQALGVAAQKTADTIAKFHATNIEDFEREVKVQQQVDEIAGKLGAKYADASQALKDQLRAEIAVALTRRSENEKTLAAAQQAAEFERKYGDGTAQAAKTREDLNRAERTNIATKQALARATKVQGEADEQARLEAKRYDDTLESLAAGFEHAANAYARANDLYSQGSELFNSLTSAMGEGLDALLGKSTKTFGQIAADFAAMLARMALQAATSAIFKSVFGAISGAGGLFGDTLAPDVAGPVRPGLFGNIFGGARASGGPVYPGMSYDVGEHGPERFVPTVAGQIQPASATTPGSVTVNVDMNKTDGADSPGQALEFGRRVRAAVVQVIAQEKRPGGTLYSRANA